jgi:prolyl oligopeptidase
MRAWRCERLILLPILCVLVFSCGEPLAIPESTVEFSPPPETRVETVVDTLHGQAVEDPYRWLEDGGSPETRAWVEAQRQYTAAIFAQLPGREDLLSHVTSLLRTGWMDSPVEKGGRYFYGMQRAEDELPIIYYRDGYTGEDRVLIDPHGMSEDHSISISLPQRLNCPICRTLQRQNEVSDDGKLMVYAVRQGGAGDVELRIRDIDTGKDLPDVLPPANYMSVQLTPDNAGLYYSTRETEEPRVRYHTLGTDVSEDGDIFGEGYGMADIPFIELSPDGKWLLVTAWRGNAGTMELHLKDLQSDSEWVEISKEGVTVGGFAGDKLLLTTTVGVDKNRVPMPNRRVVVADLASPRVEHWVEFLPAPQEARIQGAAGVGGYYFVGYEKDGQPSVTQYDTAGNWVREIEFGTMGSVFGPAGEWDKKEAFVVFTSFHVPKTEYRMDVNTGETEVWFRPDVPVDSEAIEVKRVQFASKDGRTLPMSIVHAKGLELDGDRPTFLTGYPGGAYTPAFWPQAVLLMDMGGVFALASPRAGSGTEAVVSSDFGSASDDFVAAAEYLIEEGYTRPERLALMGRSWSGLLAANALIRRPELFGAVVCGYPLADMIRYHRFAPRALSLFGSPEDPEQLRYIKAHSPYHNAVEGTLYSATLFVASDDDPLANPLHARKMTAMVQATNGGEKPVMLRYHARAGHGRGLPLPLSAEIEEMVDLFAFLRWQVGGTGN